MSDAFYEKVGAKRIGGRQIDELIGIARGLLADGSINQQEVEYLHRWLIVNAEITTSPIIALLKHRIDQILVDGVADDEERHALFDALNDFANVDSEIGEDLVPTGLPLCAPAPVCEFEGRRYCFTGTFTYGQRKDCEAAVKALGASVGSIAQSTDFLVIGSYVTSSWKHSSFGTKIEQAVEWRAKGLPISIITEAHWRAHI